MNAFTSKRRLVDIRVYRKSESGRKGGTMRANAEGGAALKSLSNNQPKRRAIAKEKTHG